MRRGALIAILAVLALAPGAASAPHRHRRGKAIHAATLSGRPVGIDRAWQRYALDQGGDLIYPKKVEIVAGNPSQVVNPDGLMAPGGGVTTINSSGRGTPRIVLDMGIDAGGYVEVGVTRSDGSDIHLGYAEAQRFLTPNGDQPDQNGKATDDASYRQDDIATAGDWQSPGNRGGERWISLQLQGSGSVSIDYVRIREEHLHPTLADYTGHFLSSDDLLNRIWYASEYTFSLDSVDNLHSSSPEPKMVVVDGGKRDRAVWLGDLVIENTLGDYALRQAPRVIRDSLQSFSCHQDTDGSIAISEGVPVPPCPDVPPAPTNSDTTGSLLPEYTAWWIVALHDYDMLTGDDAFVRRMLPVARRAIAYYTDHLDSNGLYTTREPAITWHVVDDSQGEDGHTNAAIYRALTDMAEMEARNGLGETAAAVYTREADAFRHAMIAHLWDPSAGAFLLNSDDPLRDHSQDAQVEAVLDGVVTGDMATSALRFIDQHLETTYGVMNAQYNGDPYMTNYISPYISSTELLARLAHNDTADALSLMRREWGKMVNTDPGTTVWERMDFAGDASGGTAASDSLSPYTPNVGKGFTSLAHGWAGGPVPALSGYILGIRPMTPGYTTWIVEPQVGDLRWAQGQAPTPYGPVVSRWTIGEPNQPGAADSFTLTAGGTAGTTGTVAVPLLGAPRAIYRDGRLVWRAGHPARGVSAVPDGDYVRFGGVHGVHTYAWSGSG